jgi:HPt (histidine-containing phosphotransfer) domain-containing protein
MSMDDLLKELQLEYIQGIPEKIQEIKDFSEKKDLENLLNSFHKLKGSGKTYGLPEVSTLGEFFEGWLREKKEKAIPFTQKAIGILERIHASRTNSKPYSLDTDAEFQTLKSLK